MMGVCGHKVTTIYRQGPIEVGADDAGNIVLAVADAVATVTNVEALVHALRSARFHVSEES